MTDAELEVEMASAYHPNDHIEAALAAMDKVTPGPWCSHYIHDLLRIGRKSLDITTDCDCLYEPDENDATLIAAAPDLAAEVIRLRKWQDDAFCHVEISRNYLSTELKTMKDDGSGAIDQLKQFKDEADRLIAEAEGE